MEHLGEGQNMILLIPSPNKTFFWLEEEKEEEEKLK
jgi:hypothetical protein